MRGWIKTHRSLLTSNIFRNEKLLKVFMWCLLKASHAEHEQVVGRQSIKVEPGQFVFGRKVAALELSMKESSVYDYIKLLEKSETIRVNSNNKFSVITVVNWVFYQGVDEDDQQQTNNKSTTNQQQIDTNKNGNKGLNGDNGKKVKTKYLDRVYLTTDEYNRLVTEFGQEKITEMIERVNGYTKKEYTDHNLTIRKWIKRDEVNRIPAKKPNKSEQLKALEEELFGGQKASV